MASSKASKKRIRQNDKRRTRNRPYKSAMRTEIKKFHAAIEASDADLAAERLQFVSRQLDKLATKGIIHKNQAARCKSRMSEKLKVLTEGAGPSEAAV